MIFEKKTEYPENRESSETFFPYSFLKLNSLQAYIKKIKKSISDKRGVPKLKKTFFSKMGRYIYQNL
jgi:hypothetical protein